MLIHGLGDGAYIWADFARHLPADYRAFAVDLRGHGYSPRSADGLYFTDRHVADLIDTLDRLGLDRVVLIGHSLGAEIALRLAIARPERVAALVAVDFAPESNPTGLRVIHNLVNSVRLYATIDEYLQWLARTRPMASMEMLRYCAAESLEGSADQGFRLRIDPQILSLAHAPSSNASLEWTLLARVACPTLILRGSSSAVLSKAAAERMAATLPHCTLQEITRSGHAIMLENPAGFREHVAAFLREVRERVRQSGSSAS